jgi:hypothetical protein
MHFEIWIHGPAAKVQELDISITEEQGSSGIYSSPPEYVYNMQNQPHKWLES